MARRTAFNLVRLPTLQSVGVGGLEPPTSASQTRRASRLRYTPADKSIIRMMHKRQAFIRILILVMMLLLTLFMYGLTACSQVPPNLPIATDQSPLSLQPTKTQVQPTDIPFTPSSTPTSDCFTGGGNIESHVFISNLQQSEFNFQVYLPPCYLSDPQERYPVVYLLHGLSYQEDQWVRLGLVEQMDRLIGEGEIAPFLIVLPQEAVIQPPQSSAFPKIIIQELIPWIDSHYATNPERVFRAIGGLSRGAAWAVHIGFENPDFFCQIGAHSLPLFQVDSSKLLNWLSYEPHQDLPDVFIDIGRDDKEWQSAKEFADLLDQYHIPHEWYFYKNGHTETYWSEHLEQYLRWYARDW